MKNVDHAAFSLKNRARPRSFPGPKDRVDLTALKSYLLFHFGEEAAYMRAKAVVLRQYAILHKFFASLNFSNAADFKNGLEH